MKELTHEHHGTGNPNRLYKDRIFRMIFNSKAELLSLYNAMNGTAYQNPDELEINTLENAIYMGMRNDLSFLIDSRLPLYEHQSTYNPNIPLRDFLYSASLYSRLVAQRNLYGSKRVKIPTPQFVVFYNGMEEQPERQELLLSDSFEIEKEEKSLELKVVMLNINKGYNETLKAQCRTLREYMDYVERVREHARTKSLEDAVEQAIKECIAEGILADFLRNHKSEAVSMSIFEYDEEAHMRMEREESRADGLAEGLELGLQQGLEQGLARGQRKNLMALIQVKQRKGKDIATIADELETDVDTILELSMMPDGEHSSVLID